MLSMLYSGTFRIHTLLLLATVLYVVGAVPQQAFAHESTNPNEVIIHISEAGFEPKSVTIQVGQTVVFENTGKEAHWPASNIHPTHRAYPGSDIEKCGSDDEKLIFDACRGLQSGETYAFIFAMPGTWKYHDHLNPTKFGTVVVE